MLRLVRDSFLLGPSDDDGKSKKGKKQAKSAPLKAKKKGSAGPRRSAGSSTNGKKASDKSKAKGTFQRINNSRV